MWINDDSDNLDCLWEQVIEDFKEIDPDVLWRAWQALKDRYEEKVLEYIRQT